MKQSQVGVPIARHAQRRVGLTEDFHCPGAAVEGVGSLGLAQDWEQEKPTPKQVGRMGEQMAKAFLEAHGYSVITMNWRCRSGEADIVAFDNQEGVTTLVEVKSRTSTMGADTLFPEKAVDRRKQDRYQRIALTWLAFHPKVNNVRFDVVGLNIYAPLCAKVRLVPGAFEWDE